MADGHSLSIYPSEEIVITAGNPVQVATYAEPPADAWYRWNDARSDRLGESVSARYVPHDVYGAEDLDYYGYWRVVPEYGPVWIPRTVAPGWAPYSAGSWVWDPYYEWTWIDDAPWGWAPFHYGRWVHVGGYWAWAPGPVVRRSVYAPALVAFLIHDHDVSVRIGLGFPGVWWVALSGGEPVLPWWGHHRHRWHPHWAGWGGPRVVNNVVINQTTIINVDDIYYHNAKHPHAIVHRACGQVWPHAGPGNGGNALSSRGLQAGAGRAAGQAHARKPARRRSRRPLQPRGHWLQGRSLLN